jgi:hypothetical protein
MRRFFSIPLALLILLSGMHISIATHFCGGAVAATRVSLSGEKATCGMEHDGKTESASEKHFSSNCCENKTSVYSVESNFTPSANHYREIVLTVLHEFQIPESYSFHTGFISSTFPANASPPGYNPANAVSIAGICAFRI